MNIAGLLPPRECMSFWHSQVCLCTWTGSECAPNQTQLQFYCSHRLCFILKIPYWNLLGSPNLYCVHGMAHGQSYSTWNKWIWDMIKKWPPSRASERMKRVYNHDPDTAYFDITHKRKKRHFGLLHSKFTWNPSGNKLYQRHGIRSQTQDDVHKCSRRGSWTLQEGKQSTCVWHLALPLQNVIMWHANP